MSHSLHHRKDQTVLMTRLAFELVFVAVYLVEYSVALRLGSKTVLLVALCLELRSVTE